MSGGLVWPHGIEMDAKKNWIDGYNAALDALVAECEKDKLIGYAEKQQIKAAAARLRK